MFFEQGTEFVDNDISFHNFVIFEKIFCVAIHRDRELLKRGYYGLTQEMIYQWLGSWVTPYWWSDAHVNKALASFLAANIVLEVIMTKFIQIINVYEYVCIIFINLNIVD